MRKQTCRWAGVPLALIGVLVTAVTAPPRPAYASGLAFPDGHWSGDATLVGGASYGSTVSYQITGGGCGFEMTVAGGKVTDGVIRCQGTTEGDIHITGRTLHVTTHERAEGPLSGSASSVRGALTDTFGGTVEGLGSAGPFSTAGSVTFQPQSVDCGVASGDLAAYWRAVQQSFGMNSTEQAIFYAVRDAGGAGAGAASGTSAEFTKLMGDLAALAAEGAKNMGAANYLLELQRLAYAAVAYLSKVLKNAQCPDGQPPGAWQQDALAKAFQTAIDHAFVGPGGVTFTLPEWAEVLTLGLQTNAVVPPRSGPGSENALWDAIEAELGKQLAAAIADGDQSAIFYIYDLAYGAGMTDLAAQALKAMKK